MKPECLWNVQFGKIQQNDEQSWEKKIHKYVEKVDFCLNLYEVCGCHDKVKSNGRSWHIQNLRER